MLALVGENGAGKSTLMKILAGAQPADSGKILIDGDAGSYRLAARRRELGIGMIYQEFNLVPSLGAIDNIVLGNEPARPDRSSTSARRATVRRGVFTNSASTCRSNVADSQAIRRAAADGRDRQGALARRAHHRSWTSRPRRSPTRETDAAVRASSRRSRRGGAGIIYISHRLEELPRDRRPRHGAARRRRVETRDPWAN